MVYQKSSDMYTLNGQLNADTWVAGAADDAAANTDHVGLANQMIARNTVASACPVALDLMIQSSVGSYRYSSDGFPYLKGRSELFFDTMKNSYLKYCDGCEFNWEKHNGVVFLRSSDYARGLGSEGSSMPVVFNAKCRFENRRQFIDGTGAASTAAGGNGLIRDVFMSGNPLMLAIFPRMYLLISPSSGLISSQNISHASAQQVLSQTQAAPMRR